jgi:hypothetical protein
MQMSVPAELVRELQQSVDRLLEIVTQDGQTVQSHREAIQRVLDAQNALNPFVTPLVRQ